MKQFFGKYRGKVTNNLDPMRLGRLQVEVPAVLGKGRSSWALPCVPYAGKQVGLFVMPDKGTNVWVEFEGGDPDYPIWSGCFWGTGELPILATAPTVKLFQLAKDISVRIDETTKTVKVGVGGTPIAPLVSLIVSPQAVEIDYSGIMGLKLGSGTIEIANGETTAIKILPTGIELASSPLSVKLDAASTSVMVKTNPATTIKVVPDSVQLTQGSASLKVAAPGIEAKNGAANIKVTPAGVELSAGPAKAEVLPAAIELKNAAGSVKVLPAMVNINNGALEAI